MPLKSPVTFVTLALLAGCLVPTEEHSLGSAGDGGIYGTAFERCVDLVSYREVLCTTVWPVVCSGVTCAKGELCCQTTGACVAPGSPACPSPPTNALNANETSCGSNADCATGQYCVPDDFQLNSSGPQAQRCISSSGHCRPLNGCAYCGSPPAPGCRVCGCDGRTYASPQHACVAGVSAPNMGPCGEPTGHDAGAFTILCGTNDQCPSGAQCCFRTGKCFDASEPWRCEVQPNGSILNCTSHSECNPGSGGGSGGDDSRLCAAEGCGGPGLCSTRWPPSHCGGEVRPVCGCDGVNYVNDCWARSAGVRVSSTGSCP